MDPSRIVAIVVIILLLAIVLFRGIGFRRLNSADAKDRSFKIFYMVGLMIALLFIVGAVLWQIRII
ncbi:MAG TPA: hypothetical protein VGM01_00440 [Ktedonobacteraceae bacterium]|jgi:hypothetical protein